MGDIEALLARGRRPGTFVERSHFTLAREKALDKMREFNLRDPRQYVLELVQAAVFAGASYIAVDVRPDSVLVAWVDGVPLKRSELEDLFSYLFSSHAPGRQRHLVQLAIGVNALMGRKPRRVRLETGDGSPAGTLRMDLDRKGKGTIGVPTDPMSGTYLHATFGGGWLARFRGDTFTPEQGLIETRCRYTPVPILLNGDAPFGYKASRAIQGGSPDSSRAFDDGLRRGVVSLAAEGSSFELVVGGVVITRKDLPELASHPLRGVICDDRLRKTADQSDVVADAAFTAMLHGVQPHATELVRSVQEGFYRPPALPRQVAQPAPAAALPTGPTAEAIPPGPIQQPGPRPALALAALQALPPEVPLFWVVPEQAEAMAASVDPGRFPFPVLVLRPGQALTLDEELPHHALSRLATVADADFVRRMLERGRRQVQVVVPLEDGLVLHLSLVTGGAPAAWHDPREGSVPYRVGDPTGTRATGVLAFDLPGVSAAFLCPRPLSPEAAGALGRRWSGRVFTEAWRLVAEDLEGADSQELLCRLLGHFLTPCFVEGAGGRILLAGHLPKSWGAAAQELRTRPLARLADGGSLHLDELLALQGTDKVLTLADEAELARLGALEEHTGWGHLQTAALAREVVVAVGLGPAGWSLLSPGRSHAHARRQVLWLGLSLAPEVSEGAWVRVESPVAGLGAALRSDTVVAEDWTAGCALLLHHLQGVLAAGDFASLSPEHPMRVRGLVRVASLGLAAFLDTPPLLMGDDGHQRTLDQLLALPGAAAHPRHGAVVDEPHTVSLHLDELLRIRGEGSATLPLRYDDGPQVLASLAQGRSEGWLVRRRVSLAGLEGWLGLRLPGDPTGGVFHQASGSMVALERLDRLPCHGLVWSLESDRGPTPRQLEALGLLRRELYEALSPVLGAHQADSEPGRAASLYAAHFVQHALRRGPLQGTARQLALQVHLPDGRSLADWALEADVEALPPAWRARVVQTPGSGERPERQGPLPETHAALAALVAEELPGLGLELEVVGYGMEGPLVGSDARWLSSGTLVLTLNGDQPAVRRALTEAGPARELVALELARVLRESALGMGTTLDLHALHRGLVARRLA